MKKPQKYQAKPYYDLLEVLDYVDNKVKRFRKKAWDKLCDYGYIENDTIRSIHFQNLITYDTDEDIKEGIELMFEEFPDIKNGEVDFSISW